MTTDHPNDWDLRGELAAALTCWHRLSGTEAAALVQYATELHAKHFAAQQIAQINGEIAAELKGERDDLASQVSSLNVGFNNCQAERNGLREFAQYIQRTGDDRLSDMAREALEGTP